MPLKTSNTKRKAILGTIAFAVLLLVVVGGYLGLRSARAATDQPIAYSHRIHIQAGVQCLYCHSESTRSQIAGIPSVEKCMGCHAVIAKEGEAVQTLVEYWERGEAISWEKVNHQPDFVYFSHQRHIGSGVNCETCHGNVGEMDLAEPVGRMDMGWCLDCHLEQAPEKTTHLADCLTCHK